jgi:hypothetical protein
VGRRRYGSSSRFQLVVGVPQRVVHLAGDSVHPHLPDFSFLEMSARWQIKVKYQRT